MIYTEQNFNDDILFISSYLAMEKSSLPKAKKLLMSILPTRKFDHLYNSWVGRYDTQKKIGQFGSFFSNIEHRTQALFLIEWGIEISDLEDYLQKLNSSPIASLTATPPVIIERLHYLLIFFLNHGINEIVNDYSLIDLPKERFGNSYNWGNYILSLNKLEQFRLLSHLSTYTSEQILNSNRNRDMLKSANFKTV